MLRPVILAAAAASVALALLGASRAQQPAFTPRDESVEDLPPGPGREETFYMCVACHAYRLVSNQGLTRERWDETLTLMTERHKMVDIQGADRDLILDYLAQHHPPRPAARQGGFRNPFAPN